MRMRSRYDFRKLSYDQKEQLFNALPILNAVEEGDADKLHIFLESKCVHYANGTTGKACPCVGLTTIFDKKRRDFVEGNILVFAGANLKYQVLCFRLSLSVSSVSRRSHYSARHYKEPTSGNANAKLATRL